MSTRRTTLSVFICVAFLCMFCQCLVVHAADPQFRPHRTFSFTTLSPFPTYDPGNPNDLQPAFISSITPSGYRPIMKLVRGDEYKTQVEESSDGRYITYRKRYYNDFTLTPVTVEYDSFVSQRIAYRTEAKREQVYRSSLYKDQKKKAGGLLQFTIPIQSRTFESIFGEGGASLKVSGYRKISFSGRSSWTDKPQTVQTKQSKFPTLEMEQLYRFNIEGTIGSKITVRVNQDSNNDIPLANRLLLRYKGADDDILQTVEAGNTTLNLPATRFLQYSTQVQGLFGLKATAQLADVSITAIASQEKGNTESINITAGGGSAATRVIKDIQYLRYTFFDLGRLPWTVPSRSNILKFPDPSDPLDADQFDFQRGDSILKVIAYIDDYTTDVAEQRSRQIGVYYVNPPPGDTLSVDSAGQYRKEAYFEEMESSDYYFNPTEFYIQFIQNTPGTNDILAVYMEILRANGVVDTVGQLSNGADTLRLKLIKPGEYRSDSHVFEYEWKNVYNLNARNINLSDLEIDIYKGKLTNTNAVNVSDKTDQNGVNFLTILGLDFGDVSGNGEADGKIDKSADRIVGQFRKPIIDADNGYLIFPSRHPFDSRYVSFDPYYGVDSVDNTSWEIVNIDSLSEADLDKVVTLDEPVDMYTSPSASQLNTETKYYIAVTLTGTGQSTIDLNSVNIIEGSEVVTYQGNRLTRGQDYNINYSLGTLTLLKDEYTDVNSDLSVMFENAPYFSLAKKTLLGSRIEYKPSNNFRLGTTLLYKSDKLTSRKPKVGEETSKIFVWDVDFNYKFTNNLMTSLANLLPFYSSSAQSYTQLSGEFAESRPNPNVDGEVYIDDFEGSRDNLSVGLLRGSWTHASAPAQLPESRRTRGRIAWYTFTKLDPQVVYPRRDTDASEDAAGIIPLTMRFKPVTQYLQYTDTTIDDAPAVLVDTIDVEPENTWGGFMQALSSGARETLRNTELLEFRIYGDVGTMHIDLGQISEDINGNGILNTEDTSSFNRLYPGDDKGLDFLNDDQERKLYPDSPDDDPAEDNSILLIDKNAMLNLDDYPEYIYRVNGTQGNAEDPEHYGLPDTEDINEGGLDKLNNYFSYRVDLSDTSQFEVPDSRSDPDADVSWKTLRIPLRDPKAIDTTIGTPDWEYIDFIRIWFDSAGTDQLIEPDSVMFAAIDLVSTTWGDSLRVADSVRSGPVSFDVAVVNQEINGSYTSPPGVEGYTDVTRDVVETEQSLSLTFENLNGQVMVLSPDSGFVLAADTGLAVRYFYRAMNLMGYRRLQAYVHGSQGIDSDSILFFFRLGTDSLAYYEYRTILKPGWDPENYVDIDFEEMTGLKAKLIEEYNNNPDSTPLIKVDDAGKYVVKVKSNMREPTLTSVVYFAMGVVNLDTAEAASGEVWIDELRLSDVRNDVGHAMSFAVNGNMADLMTYNFSYSNQDAFYRGVSNATKGGASDNLGSGTTKKSYSFSGTFNLHNFFPRSLEMRMPINVTWSENVQEPLLRSGTDITVPEEFLNEETSVTVSRGFGVRESFSKKTNNLLFAAFLNRLSTDFTYNVTTGHNANQPSYLRERYSGSAKFDVSLSKTPNIKIFKWTDKLWSPFGLSGTRLYLYPTKWNFSGSLKGSNNETINDSWVVTRSRNLDFRGDMSLSYKIFDNLNGSYSVNVNSDLKDPNTVNITLNPKKFKFGIDQSYSQSFKIGYSPKLFNFLTHSVDYSSSFTDATRTISSSDSTYYHNATVKNNTNLSLTLDHTKLIGTNKGRRGGNRRDKNKDGGGATSIIALPLKGIRYITDAIEPIKGGYRVGKSIANPGLSTKAGTLYRLGLTEDPGVDILSSINTGSTRPSKSTSKSYSASSGVKLFSGVSADVTFNRDERETFISNPSITVSETWPDVKFNLRTLRGLWYIGDLINYLSPSSKFTRTLSWGQRKSAEYRYEFTEKKQFSPLFSFTINPSRSMRTSFRMETSSEQTTKYNESTGSVTNAVKRSSVGYSGSYSFTFSSPSGIKLPIFGRIKFESSMTFAVDVTYRLNKAESASKQEEDGSYNFTLTEDKSALTIQPKASYSFSSTVKGGLTLRWQDNNDSIRQEKRHTREVSLWVEMRF
ncbi:MAG: cell surface protein SprA [Candidatus Zixiibacteriota bacterium]